MPSRFLGIDHLGIAVTDLESATATYRDILGFVVEGGEQLTERGLDVRFVETGNARIELLAATRDDSEISGFLAKRGPGIHHLCVRVDDLDAALEQMRQNGARIVGGGSADGGSSDSGVQIGAHGRRVAFVHPKTTGGVLLELVEINEK